MFSALRVAIVAAIILVAGPAFAYNPIPCPTAGPNDIVLLVGGQSNAGSYGDVGFQPTTGGDIQIWYATGACYPLADQMVGVPPPPPPNGGGSIWTRFAQLYRNAYPLFTGRIVIVMIAEGGVPISNWAQGGQDYPRIKTAVDALANLGWKPSAFLFMDGESDGMSGSSYDVVTAALNSFVNGQRAAGYTYPIFIGINSTCRAVPDSAKQNGIDPAGVDFETLSNPAAQDYRTPAARMYQQSEVQRALWTMNDPARNVSIGANTDLISGYNRWDGCHENSYAQWVSAQLWFDVLKRAHALPCP